MMRSCYDSYNLDLSVNQDVQIALFSPEVKIVSIAEFFNDAINRTVGTIRDCEPDSHYIVYATIYRNAAIYRIHKEHGWAYPACENCNKRVDVLPPQNQKPLYFFNNNFVKLSGYTTWELIEKHNIDPDEYWPEELDSIVGKKGLFKIFNSYYNVTNNNHTYRCDAFSDDVKLINHFKKSFLNMDSEDEESKDVLETSTTTTTKFKNHADSDE
ncbi:replication protein A 70 kDa DNA-binding subunit B [Tanacetum coccineum]|uniref:Replication protein A 70 kDa DNA-binding subunit B n=1 Tax=Tanacetum coccineum TaxID=301880 RepID=A0ABQ5AR13_9ASTR